ncbi:MAG TPA: diguanylate cyclase, partial [Chromatiaceae bacterium]|nr:diguanylate cyclase [Chromatiaceae bacterium]
DAALLAANKLRRRIEKCGFHFRDKKVTITVSCGLSEYREGDTAEEVFERADQALYEAKKQGRNRCVAA